jgi:hypothetical protein
MSPGKVDNAYIAPFPDIPEALRKRFSNGALFLRAFGFFPQDREIDFDLSSRPLLETDILRCCTLDASGNGMPEDFFWDLEVGTRTECMLIIATLSQGVDHFTIDLRCAHPDCGEDLELDFPIREFVDRRWKTPQEGAPTGWNEKIGTAFRRPTGRDQLQWLEQPYSDKHSVVQAMAETLAVDGQAAFRERNLDDGLAQSIGETLGTLDPLLHFKVPLKCPECGGEDLYAIDLGAQALGQLRRGQDRLLEMVFQLASQFHWTEEEILAIPPWRRFRYLALIEKEGSR